ncbi:hypothetical protein K491DRAFT_694516 [Lophiostoma macrostomum CBS 122681]|uniref:Uncharacterized protein n=1 Tax=Lophiostoma macrostomum CBS 122681 TaxID=1314788 RepID=A0A6A6T455_9PLEO|nr:hypothetical protein K491DRAFT_694516 [Lophiostoma macrostomum CBS 122681]
MVSGSPPSPASPQHHAAIFSVLLSTGPFPAPPPSHSEVLHPTTSSLIQSFQTPSTRAIT